MYVTDGTAKLLGKIALSGLWSGNIRLSEEIFSNLIPLREGQSGPILGLAMCHAHRGHYAKGIEILEKQGAKALQTDPHSKAWYGLMLCMNKNNARGRDILEKLLADDSTPEDVRGLAEQTLLDIK